MNRFLCILLIAIIACTGSAYAQVATELPVPTIGGEAQIAVTDIRMDPEVFMRGDIGTVTIEVTNNGDVPVALSRAYMLSNDLRVVDESTYNSVGSIGAGNRMYFTFTIRADAPDGIYYPTFYIDFLQAGIFRFPVKLTVESTELQVSILNKPDVFARERTEDIHLIIGNPRDNPATGIIVSPKGTGIDATQTFVGKLDPDTAANVTVEITPYEEGDLTFDVMYKNGINEHVSSLTIPVIFGEAKMRAEPVLNNIEVRPNGGYYIVTGDVTNAGLETAYSVVITVGEPGIPVDPYRSYVVGGLDPDDFSSFEVTFQPGNATSVPILVQYKDKDGNLYQDTQYIDMKRTADTPTEEGWSALMIGAVVVIALAIGGAIFYTWWKKR
jgi:hypothetical protein